MLILYSTFISQPYGSQRTFPSCFNKSSATSAHTPLPRDASSPPRGAAAMDDEHAEDAGTTIICIDTIKDIGNYSLFVCLFINH